MKTNNYIKMLFTLFLAITTSMLFAVTAPVTVNVKDSQGNNIAAHFKVFKGPNYVGQYNAGATVQLDVGDTYKIFAHYQGTSTDRVNFVVASNGNTFNYTTTNVQFNWSGGYLDYRSTNSWSGFGKTNGVWNARELFPNDFYGNPLVVRFGNNWQNKDYHSITLSLNGVTNYNKTISLLKVIDHNGNPIAGATARGGYATPTVWHVTGVTDANGDLIDLRNGLNANLSYEMRVNNTVSASSQQISSFYNFQTQEITMRAEKCDGTPLAGGHVRWGNGSTYSTYHFAGGNTDATGETKLEFFPGTYSFEMGLNWTTDTEISWNFPGDGATVLFKTTSVTLNYSSSISFGGPTGDSHWFAKPTMELFPGTYKFNFKPSNRVDVTVGNCSTPVVLTAAFMRLIDSQGNGLAGAVGKYYKSGWHNAGTTDANGSIFMTSSTLAGNIPFRMYWKGGSQQISQNITTNSTVVFQTKLATAQLNNSGGSDLMATFKYYASGWKTFGTGTATTLASMELLPINYPFRVYYVGASLQKSQNISVDKDIVFATEAVTAELNDHNGADLSATFKYYASGWKTFGTGTATTLASMELLPRNYPFRVYYAGASLQKSQNITAPNSNVVFGTVEVTANLADCDDTDISASYKYYASGWKVFGSGTDVTKELLPVNYPFRVYLNGASNQKSQNVSTNGNVDFTVTNVTINYPGTVKYYASGWKVFKGNSTGFATLAMLPKTYPFRFYTGTSSVQRNMTISGCSMNTGVITLVDEAGNPLANYPSDFSTETRNLKWKYRCGGSWGPSTSFQTDANGQVFYNIDCTNNNWDSKITMTLNQTTLEQDVTINPVFQAAKVNVNLKTCNGLITAAPGGTVKQGGGFWYTHGTTGTVGTVSLYAFPSASVKLRMNYNHGTQTLFPAVIAGTNEVDFTTTALTLVNSGGDIKSNAGGSWWTFAQPTMNLLPGVYNFKFQTGNTWTSLIPVNVTGCSMGGMMANITLKDANGGGILGGVVTYTPGGNNWSTLGTTDANGNVYALIPTGTGGDSYKMTYKGQWMTKWHNMTTGGSLEFNTRLVTMRINDGTSDVTGTSAKYHGNAGGEWQFGSGTTTTSMEMLDIPNGIKFYVTYNGSTLTRNSHKFSIDGDEVLFMVSSATASKRDVTDNEVVVDAKTGVYPNPFTDMVTFSFELTETSNVRIVIYDLSGKVIKTVANGEFSQGTNQVQWNGNTNAGAPAAAGVYFYRLEAGEFVKTNRIILSR